MRAFFVLLISVFVAIGVGIAVEAAAGSSNTGAAQLAQQALTSIGDSHYLQLEVSMSDSGPALRSNAFLREAGAYHLAMDVSVDPSVPLSRAGITKENLDLFITRDGARDVEVRLADDHLYAQVDLAALAKTLPLSAADRNELIQANALVGNRWLELPQSSASSFLKDLSKSGSTQPSATATAEGQQLIRTLESAIRDHGSVSTGTAPNGEREVSATVQLRPFLQQFVGQALPLIEKSSGGLPGLGITTPPADAFGSVKGNLSGTLYVNDANQLRRVDAVYSSPDLSMNIVVEVAHQPLPVTAPAGSTLLPQSVINAFRQSLKIPSLS